MNRMVMVTVVFVSGLMAALSVTVAGALAQGTGPQSPAAPIGSAFTYQGQLQNGSGPVTGPCDFQFGLWNAATPGAQVGVTQTQTSLSISNGLFTTQLDFGAAAFDGNARWLAIAVRCPAGSGSYSALTPRQSLAAAPYASTANRLSWGASWSGSGSGTGLSVSGGAVGLSGSGSLYGVQGQTASATGYGVHGSGPVTGTMGEATNTSGAAYGVYGVSKSSATNSAGVYGESAVGRGVFGSTNTGYGLYGLASGAGGFGVIGYSSANTGLSTGVYGVAYSTSGRGLYGLALSTSGNAEGVYGRSDSTAGYGVEGHATATSGTTYGVYGRAASLYGYGVYGTAPITGVTGIGTELDYSVGVNGQGYVGVIGYAPHENGKGVLGQAQSGSYAIGIGGTVNGNGWAGYFVGKVDVLGNFSATGTKAFKIDHPLNPDKQYLYHYAIETPDVQNLYNGTIVLDAQGEAVVTLPDYFSALNGGEFRYTLTAIGAPMPNLYIAQEVSGNTFKIAGGVAGNKVSWTVFAQRNDPWLRDHPATDVVDKPAGEAGTYLYPQGYGQPESNGMNNLVLEPAGGQ